MAKQDDDSFLEINEHELDREWVGQPKLYFHYARKLADADKEVDEAKADLDLVRAEMDQEIRSSPDAYGLEKVTETAISGCILMQDEYKDAHATYLGWKHKAAILKAACIALDQRKKALEKLVDLHGQQYFSSPKAKGENREAMEQVRAQSIAKRGQQKRTRTDE